MQCPGIWMVFAKKNSKKNTKLINVVYGTCALYLGVWEHTPWITYLYGNAAHYIVKVYGSILPGKKSLKIMSFEVHIEKNCF